MINVLLKKIGSGGFAGTMLLLMLTVGLSGEVRAQGVQSYGESLSYLDDLLQKVRPSLQRFLKKNQFQETVVLTSLSGQKRTISTVEKNYLISAIERQSFWNLKFTIIPSIEAFNQTTFNQQRYLLAFENSQEDSIAYAKKLGHDYYMIITIEYRKRTIGMDIAIYKSPEAQNTAVIADQHGVIWKERVSIYYEPHVFNFDLGILQTVSSELTLYFTAMVSSYLTKYFYAGVFFAGGYTYVDTMAAVGEAAAIRYILAVKFGFSILRRFARHYRRFDLLLASRFGIDGKISLAATTATIDQMLGNVVGTVGVQFFIIDRISVNAEIDIGKIITSSLAGRAATPVIYFELSYHF